MVSITALQDRVSSGESRTDGCESGEEREKISRLSEKAGEDFHGEMVAGEMPVDYRSQMVSSSPMAYPRDNRSFGGVLCER
jgi:hypothetical protein